MKRKEPRSHRRPHLFEIRFLQYCKCMTRWDKRQLAGPLNIPDLNESEQKEGQKLTHCASGESASPSCCLCSVLPSTKLLSYTCFKFQLCPSTYKQQSQTFEMKTEICLMQEQREKVVTEGRRVCLSEIIKSDTCSDCKQAQHEMNVVYCLNVVSVDSWNEHGHLNSAPNAKGCDAQCWGLSCPSSHANVTHSPVHEEGREWRIGPAAKAPWL